MKSKLHILSLLLLSLLVLSTTSCFKPNEEGIYDILGPVATIPVFTITPATPAPGQNATLRIRYYSENVPVKQLRFNAIIAGNKTNVSTKEISGFNTANSYEETFTYTVPQGTALGTVITLEVEVVATNDLVNSRRGNITVR
jgi:hypothetical protein